MTRSARMGMTGVVVAILLGIGWRAEAAIPQLINYQGCLTDAAGTPLTGSHTVVVRMYDASSSGTKLWDETHTISLTTLDRCVLNLVMGSVTSFPSTLDWNQSLWLEVAVDGDTLTPRQRMTAVGYAINADELDGLDSTSFMRTDANTSTSGKVTITKAGTALVITPATDPDADTKMIDLQNAAGTTEFSVDSEGDVTVAGDLSVTGTIAGATAVSGTTNATFKVDTDNTTGSEPASGAGFIIEGGSGDVNLTWDATNDQLDVDKAVHLTSTSDLILGTGTFDNASGSTADAYVTGNLEVDGTIYGTVSGSSAISGTTSSTFTIDSDGNATGTDITLQFAGTSTESLEWDGATSSNFILSDDLDLNGATLLNIGNTGTDFVATTGALTLAGVLTANGGISIGATDLTGTTGLIDYTNFDVDASGNVTAVSVTTSGDVAVNGDDLTSDGDLTINPAGGQVLLADTDVLNIGGVSALAYNALANSGGLAGAAGVTADNDLYIQGDLEVDGTATFDGAVTLNSTLTCSNCFDFDDFENTLDLDAATDINLGSNLLSVDMDSTGDFAIRDGTTNVVLFEDDSTIDVTFPAAGLLTIDASTTANTTTSGVLDLNVTSATDTNKAMELSTTFTATGSATSYGLSNVWSSGAVVAGNVTQTAYANYTTATKSGADTNVGTYNLYGSYVTAANTGSSAGTKNTYGGYFSATGDTGGTATAIGLYATASSADSNYAAIFDSGLVGIGETIPRAKLEIDPADVSGISTEQVAVASDTQTIALSDGATVTNQRQNQFLAPTVEGIVGGGTETVTNAATSYIDAAPSGSNITLTNGPYALWVDAGMTRLDGALNVGGLTGAAPAYNSIATDISTASANMDVATDLYVQTDLEVDGTIYGSVSGGSAISGTTASTFTIDSDGNATGTDITLQFAGTNTESLEWDGATSSNFILSDDLDLNGATLLNIGNTGTDFVATTGALTLAGVLTANGGISIGATDLTGTTGLIDYTNFDVDASGNVTAVSVTTSGDVAVNGNDLTAGGALTINSASYVRIGDAGIPGTANADDDLYVEGDLEVDAATILGGTLTADGAVRANTDVDFTLAGGENFVVTNTTNTTAANGLVDLNATTSTADTRTLDVATTVTATGALASAYGAYNAVSSTTALSGAGVSQTLYGDYTSVAKSGADDTSGGTYTIYGTYSTASNTGSLASGTKNTYGGYFTATGDAFGTTTAIGLYASASGADSTYAAVFANGRVGVGTTTPGALVDIDRADVTSDAETVDFLVTSFTQTIAGSITNARFSQFSQPLLSATSAQTVTNAATVYLANAPADNGGGNVTITNPYALWVDAGTAQFDAGAAVGGRTGGTLGTLVFYDDDGASPESITINSASGANLSSSTTLTLPNASGTFAVSASSPIGLSATTGDITCSTCLTTSSTGSALTGTTAGTFTIDSDGDAAAADITLAFGSTNQETLTFTGSSGAAATDLFQFSDDVDLQTNLLLNIGHADTDFVATTGALTLAGVLTANGGISIGATDLTGTTGLIDYTNFDVDASGNVTAVSVTTSGDVAVNGDDLTSDGDLTINPAGGQVLLADTDVLNIGGVSALAYNALANSGGLAGAAGVTADNDLYIQGDLEVDGTANFDSSITQTFSGTTTDALSITAASLTTGQMLELAATNANTTDQNTTLSRLSFTNSQSSTNGTVSVAGMLMQWTQNTGVGITTANEAILWLAVPRTDAAAEDTSVATLLRLTNLDTVTGNSIVADNGIVVTATTASGIADGIDVSDAEIDNAINIGANPIVTGNVAGTIGDSTTDSWTFITDSTGTDEFVVPDNSISLGGETIGNYVGSVAASAPIVVSGVAGEGYTATVACTTCLTTSSTGSALQGTSSTSFKIGNATDASTTDVTLTFGNTNSETLEWDGATSDNFLLSDDLDITGGLTLTGTLEVDGVLQADAGVVFTPVTVAALGTATAGLVKAVSDASSSTDCTVGGGATYNLCLGNGTTWIDI